MSKAIRLGLVKTSLIDCPGILSPVLFTEVVTGGYYSGTIPTSGG